MLGNLRQSIAKSLPGVFLYINLNRGRTTEASLSLQHPDLLLGEEVTAPPAPPCHSLQVIAAGALSPPLLQFRAYILVISFPCVWSNYIVVKML